MHDISLRNAMDSFNFEKEVVQCNVELDEQTIETSEYDQIAPRNLFLPVILFLSCGIVAIALHVFHLRRVRQGKKSSIAGRVSMLLPSDEMLSMRKGIESDADGVDFPPLDHRTCDLKSRRSTDKHAISSFLDDESGNENGVGGDDSAADESASC